MATLIEEPKFAVQFNVTDTSIAEMRDRLSTLTCGTPERYELVRRGIAECRDMRVAVENKRKELKDDALKWGRMVDAEAKRITAEIESIEEPLKARKKAVDDEKERIRREKEEAARREQEAEVARLREAEEARLKAIRDAEDARLADERKQLAVQAEAARIEREKLAAERALIELERQQLAKEEAERQAVIKKQQDAERAAIEAERQTLAREEAARQATIKAEQEAREQLERERMNAELQATLAAEMKARREAAKPDVEKVRAFGTMLLQIVPPTVTTPAAVNELAAAMKNLRVIGTDLTEFSI